MTACNGYTAPDGINYNTSGNKTAVIPNSIGCDSTIHIDLTVLNASQSNVTATACDVYTAPDGVNHQTSGLKTAVLSNSVGCDSIITIDLTIKSSTQSQLSISSCGPYTGPNGQVIDSSGLYDITIPNSAGCDSILHLTLFINPSFTDSASITVCDNYTSADGLTYTNSGMITAVLPTVNGCDSIVYIDLTVNKSTISNIVQSSCSSYLAPDGSVFTTSGLKTVTISNYFGCDSIMNIDLTINQPTISNIAIAACDSFLTDNGFIYSSDTIVNVLQGATGCDSTIFTFLTIFESDNIDVSVNQVGNTLHVIDSEVSYQWYDCETELPITGANDFSFTPEKNGSYRVSVGNGVCQNLSICFPFIGLNFSNVEVGDYDLNVYPNPFSDEIRIISNLVDCSWKITDVTGKIIMQNVKSQLPAIIKTGQLLPGVYFLDISNEEVRSIRQLIKY